MSPVRRILNLVSLVLAAVPPLAAQNAPAVTREQALEAAQRLEADPAGPGAEGAAAQIMQFGEESDKVLITVGPETMPWDYSADRATDANERALLTAAYVAGNIRVQLGRKVPADDPYAGWTSVIKVYELLRRKHPHLSIPEADQLVREKRDGKLRARADALLKRGRELDRRREAF